MAARQPGKVSEPKHRLSSEADPLLRGGAGSSPAGPLTRAWQQIPQQWRVLIIILTEILLSIALNFYNSYLLRHVPDFKFPIIYTMVHMITSFAGSAVPRSAAAPLPPELHDSAWVAGACTGGEAGEDHPREDFTKYGLS